MKEYFIIITYSYHYYIYLYCQLYYCIYCIIYCIVLLYLLIKFVTSEPSMHIWFTHKYVIDTNKVDQAKKK